MPEMSGLRLLECLRLRVREVDFQRNEITVRDAEGGKDRVTILPAAVRRAGLTKPASCHSYTHVLNRGGKAVRSPMDEMQG